MAVLWTTWTRQCAACLPWVDAGQCASMWTHALSKRTCPKVSNGISPSTGSGRNPAVFYDLYRHTFLKDCGSHDKKTPARGMDREPDPAPGDGRKWAISGHLVLVENGSFHDHLGGWPMGGVFFSYDVWSSHSVPLLRKEFSAF